MRTQHLARAMKANWNIGLFILAYLSIVEFLICHPGDDDNGEK
jgi:hypothetical protein